MRFLLLCAALLFASVSRLSAQQPEQEVMAAVRQLFDGMRVHDTARIRAVLHPQARLVSSGMKDGVPTVTVEAMDGWLAAVSRGTEPYDERLLNPIVKLDGGLASVWTDYAFYVGEKFSHCGVDSFLLVRLPEGWRIIHIADTRRKEGCTP